MTTCATIEGRRLELGTCPFWAAKLQQTPIWPGAYRSTACHSLNLQTGARSARQASTPSWLVLKAAIQPWQGSRFTGLGFSLAEVPPDVRPTRYLLIALDTVGKPHQSLSPDGIETGAALPATHAQCNQKHTPRTVLFTTAATELRFSFGTGHASIQRRELLAQPTVLSGPRR